MLINLYIEFQLTIPPAISSPPTSNSHVSSTEIFLLDTAPGWNLIKQCPRKSLYLHQPRTFNSNIPLLPTIFAINGTPCPSPKPIPPVPSLFSMATMPKKTMGRQKVEIKRVENEDARYVTFSKRKLGLFKKATELGTLCGAEIALVMFSPAGRPYSLGLPTIDDVFHRVLSSGPAQVGSQMAGHSVESPSAKQCSEAAKNLEREISRKVVLAERLQMSTPPRWEGGLDGLRLDELLVQVQEVEELKSKVDSRVREILLQGSSSSMSPIATADAWPVGGSVAHPQYPGGFMGFDHGGC